MSSNLNMFKQLILVVVIGLISATKQPNNQTINKEGRDLIKHFEGFKPNFYKDLAVSF